MNALELAKRLGASVLNNKLRHPETGEVLARYEEDGTLALTPEGVEAAANLPAKPTRAKAPAAVESAPVASAADTSAPPEASQSAAE